MLLIDVDDHRRFDKEARPELFTATGDGRAAFTAHFNVTGDPLLLSGRDQWTHLHTRVQAVAELHGAGNTGDIGHDIVEMFALHIQPGTCAADLALIEENRAGGACCSVAQIGVGHDNGR